MSDPTERSQISDLAASLRQQWRAFDAWGYERHTRWGDSTLASSPSWATTFALTVTALVLYSLGLDRYADWWDWRSVHQQFFFVLQSIAAFGLGVLCLWHLAYRPASRRSAQWVAAMIALLFVSGLALICDWANDALMTTGGTLLLMLGWRLAAMGTWGPQIARGLTELSQGIERPQAPSISEQQNANADLSADGPAPEVETASSVAQPTGSGNARSSGDYPIVAKIKYPERFSRSSTFFRFLTLIPAVILGSLAAIPLAFLTIAAFFPIAIAKVYPRWMFNVSVALLRFRHRVSAYTYLVSDRFPLFGDPNVIFEVEYPNRSDLSRIMPFLKWFLVIPHLVVLYFLSLLAVPALFVAWMSVVASGKYPRPVFNYLVGMKDWELRVTAYSQLLLTDAYPPYAFDELFSGHPDQVDTV